MKPKLIRITTLPISMNILLRNQLSFLSKYFYIIGVSSRDNKHFHEISEREGVPMVEIEMTRKISPFKDIISLLKMVRLFIKEKPLIVHSHTPKAGLIAMLAAKITGVPLRFHTLAGMPMIEAKGFLKFLLYASEKITYACSTQVFPNSKGLYNYVLKKKMIKPEKLKIIANGSSNGIDLNFFSRSSFKNPEAIRVDTRKKWGIGENDFVFCFVGRLVRDKGLKELIEAFLKLTESINNTTLYNKIKLLLIGSFSEGRDKLDYFTRNIINNHCNIIYAGRHDDVRPFLIAADVFVFASYREGLPNSVLQACAMELPCIVSDVIGCNEIIIHGKNGLIVPSKDSSKLFETMYLIYKDNELRKKISEFSRPMIASRYEQKAFWKELLKTYIEFIEKTKQINKKLHTYQDDITLFL